MKKIVYLRSTSIINDSRATKEIDTYISFNHELMVLGWNRQNLEINFKNKNLKYEFFNKKSKYGAGIKNIISLTLFQMWLYKKLKKYRNEYDIIHACDFDTAFIASKICKKYNKKLVYDIYDYYVDCHGLGFLKKYVEKLDIKVINKADLVILCTEQRKKQISKAKPKKVITIHNTPEINSVLCDNFSKKLKLCYVGILQDDRLLLEIGNELKNNPNFELHIGGFGKYEKFFSELSDKYDNIYFYGQMQYSEVLKLENNCDILFATYNPNIKNHQYSAPNKVYEAMALGKPIVVCKNTGVDKLVTKEDFGYAINYNAKSFINVLKKIDKKEYKKKSNKAIKLYNEKYRWNLMAEKLNIEIEKL